MKVLQLCCVSNLWPASFDVHSIDIKTGTNVLSLPVNYGRNFDLICSAPPCDQFTKANSHNWLSYPGHFVEIAQHCFDISIQSGKFWFLENPPGRIEKFITGLSSYRLMTWQGVKSNKEYVIYGNFLIMSSKVKRYGKPSSVNNLNKDGRELWQPDFIQDITRTVSSLNL